MVMFVNVSEENEHPLKSTFYRCFVPSVGSFGQTVAWHLINLFKLTGCSEDIGGIYKTTTTTWPPQAILASD
jgi:hypothetical protein